MLSRISLEQIMDKLQIARHRLNEESNESDFNLSTKDAANLPILYNYLFSYLDR